MDKKRQVIIKGLLIIIFITLFIGTLTRFNIISFENNDLPETIVLNRVEFGLKEHESYDLEATIYPINSFKGKIAWESSDPNIVEVSDNGNVYGRSEGVATITATIPYNKLNVSCIIHVIKDDIPIESFSLTTNEINLLVDSEYDINYQVYPLNTNNTSIYFVSSDNNIVTVDNNGHIKANKEGIAYVKAYTFNGDSKILKVNVKKEFENKPFDLTSNNLNLNVGSKIKLKANNPDVYWETINPNIISVNDGVIEALNVGDTKVLARLGSKVEIIDVQVTKHKVNVEKIQIREKDLELYLNDSYELTVGLFPLNATDIELSYASSDSKVTTIDNGVVKAIGLGTSEITVKDLRNNAYDKITVTVYENPNDIEINELEFTEEEITMYVDSSKELSYKIDPINANTNLIWSSSDNNVVEVNDGIVKANNPGEATINVNKGEISKSISIKVIPVPLLSINSKDNRISLTKGETYRLNLGFVPNNASNINLAFTSMEPSIATIENGVIKAMDVGETVINIRSDNIELDIEVEVR